MWSYMFVALCARYVSYIYNHSCKGCRLKKEEKNILNLRQSSLLACFPKTWIVLEEGVKPGRLTNSMCTVYLMSKIILQKQYVSDCPGRVIPRVCQNPKSMLKKLPSKRWQDEGPDGCPLQLANLASSQRSSPAGKPHPWPSQIALGLSCCLRIYMFSKVSSFLWACWELKIKNNHCMCLAQIHFLLWEESQRRCHRSWQN